MRPILAIALLAWALPQTAHSDVLMIDLHVSNEEVAAAREAAQERGETLIVVPALSSAVRRQLGNLQYQAQLAAYRQEQYEKKLKAAKETNPKDPEEISQLQVRYRELTADLSNLEKQRSMIEKKIPPLDSEMIRKAIKGIEASHRPLTSLVISGHSNGLEYWGDEWEVTRQEIKGVLDQFPASRRTLRSVFLWGCYSAERGDIEWWKTSLPRLQVILGFSDVAPGAGSDASPNLLRDALARDAEMARTTDIRQASKVFRSLDDVSQTNAAAAINACYFGTRFSPVRLDSTADCPGAEQMLQKGFASFSACYAATPRCPDPPENTHESNLREYYTDYLSYAHCRGESPYIRGLPPRERVLALIFFSNVRGNFAAFYKTQIDAANRLLSQHGAGRIPDFGANSLSRATILAKLQALRALGRPMSRNAELQKLLDHAGTLLGGLDCVPTTWMTEEPGSEHTLTPPAC